MHQFPTSPIFSKVELSLVHNNKSTETASGRDQCYSDGPVKLKIETAFNKGANPDELRALHVFVNRMRGSYTPFLIEVPYISDGEGVSSAFPLVLQTAATGFLIKLKGLPASKLIRKFGDLIQHDASGHIYMLAEDLVSDANGFADAAICTPLLAPLTANDAIKINSILIKVKLTKNEHKYSYESQDIRSIVPLTFIQAL
jgi:hypothetical protein